MLALGLWLLAGRAAAVGDDYTVVNTTYGPLRGGVNGTTRYFRGIPYAAAPLGNRRWRPPSKHPVWTAERDATNFGASCLQHGGWQTINSTVQSEDCLFLNIWRPKSTEKDRSRLLELKCFMSTVVVIILCYY